MIPKECKRLAEVDFPIAVVSKHAAKEKSIRYGHPSTLHLWWARRPLGACRAMLLALVLPDPCDESCPTEFVQQAQALLDQIPGKTRQLARAVTCDSEGRKKLRAALLSFVGEFANWDLSSDRDYLHVSRSLVTAAYGTEKPLVVDPFAGGGSIPLEALRLGADAFASDLNPVACLILKTILEDIPRYGSGLADKLRSIGSEIKSTAQEKLGHLYPDEHDGGKPIAYLWARTVRCETPGCGAEIPLVRSFWLSKNLTRRRALRYVRFRQDGELPHLEFEVFEPKSDADVAKGTVSRAKATCPCCSITLSPDRVRSQLREARGGSDVVFDANGTRLGGARLLAVVTIHPKTQVREYRVAEDRDYLAVKLAMEALHSLVSISDTSQKLSMIPNEPLPLMSGTFNAPIYGMNRWGDLFTSRQKLSMSVFQNVISVLTSESDSSIKDITGLALSRFADISNALCQWENTKTQVRHLFTRQAIPMLWDFAEPAIFGGQAGDYLVTLETMSRVIENLSGLYEAGQIQLADARQSPLPEGTADIWFTDPPYYFAVPYADLSDFFFVWLKRALPNHPLLRDPFDDRNPLTPKERELCEMAHWDPVRYGNKDQAFFEEGMSQAFIAGRKALKDTGIASVVFAHKTTEGWEALLSGMIRGGFVVTASWPIATELANRLRAKESAALATSVHLVCRPRTIATVGDWAAVLRELPKRVGDWMERLQSEGVRGADLVFACIGPALEIYSRYEKVVDAQEREIPLGGNPEAKEAYERGFLAYVWEVVGRSALEQVLGTAEAKARNGAAGALEEDARLTALFLWTLQSTSGTEQELNDETEEDVQEVSEEDEEDISKGKRKKGFTLVFDVARRFAQPLGIHLEDWDDRIIETKKGIVRLLPVTERAKQLFGEDGMQTIVSELEHGSKDSLQLSLYADLKERETPKLRSRHTKTRMSADASHRGMQTHREPTTLDRVHAAMLLQASGRANALRTLLESEQERGPDFLRLANALSALYPKDAEEKRLLDAMLLAVPRS